MILLLHWGSNYKHLCIIPASSTSWPHSQALSSQVTCGENEAKPTTVAKLPGVIFDAIFVSQQKYTDLTMGNSQSYEKVCFVVLL